VFLVAGGVGEIGGVVDRAGVSVLAGTSPAPVRSPVEGAGWLSTMGAGGGEVPGDLVARGTRDVVSGSDSVEAADRAGVVSSQIVAEEATTGYSRTVG